jgi:hypothetical protein
LSQLVGGLYLLIFCILLYNGYAIQLNALADSGANGFVFINTLYIYNIAKFLELKAQRLLQPVSVKGYNDKKDSAITYIF